MRSMSLLRRGRLVAARGVPSALYGCSVTAPSVAALRSLQTAAFQAVWRAGAQCAQEVVFGLVVPWRGNPEAVSIVQPIEFLRDAIRRGVVEMESLPWPVSVAPTTGRSMRSSLHAFGRGGGCRPTSRRLSSTPMMTGSLGSPTRPL